MLLSMHVNPVLAKVKVAVTNCSNSSHHFTVKYWAKDITSTVYIGDKHIWPGQTKHPECNAAQCMMEFISGDVTKSKDTDDSELYVYVNSDHDMQIGENSDTCDD